MRIAVVTTSYPAFDGDPSGHFVESEVKELCAEGHEVRVLSPRAGGAFGWPGAAARVRERPHRALGAASWVVRATAELGAVRPERVVAHWCVPSGWPIALGAAPPDAEVELVSHGADVRLLRALPDRARQAAVDRLARRASRWRFVSSALLDELAGSLASPTALRAVAAVAPSPLGMLDVRAEVRARRGELGGRRLYVCAGRLVASKRVDKVIDYVATVRATSDRQAPVLVVLGDGPERAHLERVAERWRLDARFLGTRGRREALSWIGAADEVVHASTAEGLSTVLREAEHLGVPVRIL